jgi:hypothetical protein
MNWWLGFGDCENDQDGFVLSPFKKKYTWPPLDFRIREQGEVVLIDQKIVGVAMYLALI